MTTILGLVECLAKDGYKVTPRTIKHYIEIGLLPKPNKEGGYKEGVRLVFDNPDAIEVRIKAICDYKGKGYKLNEIKAIFYEEEERSAFDKRKEDLKVFIEKEGKYYYVIDEQIAHPKWRIPPPLARFESIFDQTSEAQEFFWENSHTPGLDQLQPLKSELFNEVEQRGLVLPTVMHPDGLFYYHHFTEYFIDYILLNKREGVPWDVLQAVSEQQAKNLDRFACLPAADGIRFTKEWVGWYRQCELNRFGTHLVNFLGRMRRNFVGRGYRYTRVDADWDYGYSSLDELILDFLAGKCVLANLNEWTPNGQDGQGRDCFIKLKEQMAG